MTSMSSTTTSEATAARHRTLRWWAAVAITSLAIAGTSTVLLTRDTDPVDWAGRAEFCKAAEELEVGRPLLRLSERVAVLQRLEQSAPAGFQEDLHELVHAFGEAPGRVEKLPEPVSRRVTRVFTFAESRCGIDVPGINP